MGRGLALSIREPTFNLVRSILTHVTIGVLQSQAYVNLCVLSILADTNLGHLKAQQICPTFDGIVRSSRSTDYANTARNAAGRVIAEVLLSFIMLYFLPK